jgi:hypothetical protein
MEFKNPRTKLGFRPFCNIPFNDSIEIKYVDYTQN